MHPEDLARVITDSGRILAHERIVHEYRFLRRDGRVVWINDELHLLRNATGQPSKPFSGTMLLQTLQRVFHPEATPKN